MSVKLTLEFKDTDALRDFLKMTYDNPSVEVKTEPKKKKAKTGRPPKSEQVIIEEPKTEVVKENIQVPLEAQENKPRASTKDKFIEVMGYLKEVQKTVDDETMRTAVKEIKSEIGIPVDMKMREATVDQLEKFLHAAEVRFVEF